MGGFPDQKNPCINYRDVVSMQGTRRLQTTASQREERKRAMARILIQGAAVAHCEAKAKATKRNC